VLLLVPFANIAMYSLLTYSPTKVLQFSLDLAGGERLRASVKNANAARGWPPAQNVELVIDAALASLTGGQWSTAGHEVSPRRCKRLRVD
jgi:hypothetical protein